MRKDAQAVLLLLIGGTLLKISFAGTYVRYVKPGQLPLLLIAGVVLIVIAGVTLWQVIRTPKEQAPPDISDEASALDDGSGFAHLAEDDGVGSLASATTQPVEAAPRLSALREDPAPRLSALREPALREESARLSVLDDSSRLSTLREDGPAGTQEVTYREFTPGELVAVPASRVNPDRPPLRGRGHQPMSGDSGVRRVRAGQELALIGDIDDRHDDDGHDDGGHDDGGHDDGHGHVHGEPKIAWLLLLPALALLLFAPPALGSYQASRNGTALSAQADSDFPPLPSGDPVRISMLDYAGRAVFDQGKSLQGRRVTLSGFVIAGPNGQPYLARMIVTCCAADARPVKVGLAGDLPTALKPDEWIEVEGSFVDRADKDPVNAELVPYIQVAAIHDINAPEQQYES